MVKEYLKLKRVAKRRLKGYYMKNLSPVFWRECSVFYSLNHFKFCRHQHDPISTLVRYGILERTNYCWRHHSLLHDENKGIQGPLCGLFHSCWKVWFVLVSLRIYSIGASFAPSSLASKKRAAKILFRKNFYNMSFLLIYFSWFPNIKCLRSNFINFSFFITIS